MTTGTTRRIDQLGRVVIPVALRRSLAIREGDLLEIAVANGQLVLRKIAPQCAICGQDEDLIDMRQKHVCRPCVNAIKLEPDGSDVVDLRERQPGEGCVEEMRAI